MKVLLIACGTAMFVMDSLSYELAKAGYEVEVCQYIDDLKLIALPASVPQLADTVSALPRYVGFEANWRAPPVSAKRVRRENRTVLAGVWIREHMRASRRFN